MTNSEQILVTCSQGVMQIGINRPEKKNALDRVMYETLCEALGLAGRDPNIKVVLLHGSDEVFSAGNDLADFDNRDLVQRSPASQFVEELHQFKKPVVAAVSGLAVGIGTTLLLHCDLVYATPDTRFRLPFVDLGVCPEAGSTLLLPLLAGHRKASELLLLGDFFDTQTAIDASIVNQAVAGEELMGFAYNQAVALAEKPNIALMTTKRLLKQSQYQSLQVRMTEEFSLFSQMLQSLESRSARQKLQQQIKNRV
ncbi:MAG: enoyl-CoA hydratase [Candidatus Thiodiazotropha sp.]